MKRQSLLAVILIALLLPACAPAAPTLLPVETIVAMTVAALPRTDTPTPYITNTPVPTDTPYFITATAELPVAAPGASCVPANTERTTARATRIIDGDTIEVVIGNNTYTVQYIGVDAPDANGTIERMGLEAAAENKRLVSGQIVTLVKDTSDMDAAGSWTRYVFVGNTFINYELIRQGLGKAAMMAPDLACQATFLSAEQEAQAGLAGLWAPTPLPTNTATSTPTPTPDATATPTAPPPCDCQTRQTVTCNNFRSQADAQACFSYCKAEGYGDVFNLDKNGNNKACEGMP